MNPKEIEDLAILNAAARKFLAVKSQRKPVVKLLPCPVCGHAAEVRFDRHEGQSCYYVACGNPDVCSTLSDDGFVICADQKIDAINQWNIRVKADYE